MLFLFMIYINKVSKEYKFGDSTFKALDDVSLIIEKGEFVSILGPSGSGKSTLMHLIGGLDQPTSGAVIVDDKNLGELKDFELASYRKRKIGFIFQQFNLLPNFTALRNVLMPLMYVNVVGDRVEYAKRVLASVGLEKKFDNKPTQMSGGEQQRVAIARALIMKPDIILADEPTGNLDSKTGVQIFEILRNLNEQGKTIIIVTHDQNIAAKTKRIIRIQDGKILDLHPASTVIQL